MNQNICNICGANYEYRNGRWICPACGAYKAEELSNEEVTLLYNAAQKLRVQEFDVAEELYSDIINKYPKQHEAYWGYVCSKYGIKYEVDFNGRKIPTCCYTTIESFIEDADYKKAIKFAPTEIADWYKSQADYIERVRKTWIEKAKKEPPYDIFISYKESDIEHGIERTEDSYNALELYNHLARQGYNVFYSKESLRDKVGEKYEPYIYHALQTAKVMIVYCSSVEYVNSTWVKNEWHRYIKQISRGEKKEGSLLVVCDGFSPNELPTILSSKQCLDGKSKNLYIDIDDYLKRLYSPKATEEKAPASKKKIVVNPLHEHTYTDEVIPASCVARGYTVHRCACGYEYRDNYTNLAEHKYAHKTTKEPTCTASGYTEEACSVCGDKKVNNIPAKGHTFGKWIEKAPPTCTAAGKKIRQCSECGYVEDETLAAKGHQWSQTEQRIDRHGNKEYVSFCKRCGEEKVSTETEEDRKIKEEKEQLCKQTLTTAIGSVIMTLSFFIFMIINFVRGEKIGRGIIYLIIAFVCGAASISFFKEYFHLKPIPTEQEKIFKKQKIKKIIIIAIPSLLIIIALVIFIPIIGRDTYNSKAEMVSQLQGWWSSDDSTIIYRITPSGEVYWSDKAELLEEDVKFNYLTGTLVIGYNKFEIKDGALCGKNTVYRKTNIKNLPTKEISDGTYIYKVNDDATLSLIGTVYRKEFEGELILPTSFDGLDIVSIGSNALEFTDITSVTIPGTIKSIERCAFSCCFDLKTVIMHEGVTSMGVNVFLHCSNITSITIPKTMQELSFTGIGGMWLRTINYNGTKSEWESFYKKNKSGFDFDGYTITVNCSNGTVTIGSQTTPDNSGDNTGDNASETLKKATINFDANGGSGTMAYQSVTVGVPSVLSGCTFTRDGYTFAGWAMSSDGTTMYTDGASITVNTENAFSLYAIWVPLHQHDYEITNTTPASCTTDGNKTYKCAGCQDTYSETIPKIAHEYKIVATTSASCTTAGSETYKCVACQDTYSETIPKLTHEYKIIASQEPTCQNDGYATHKCSLCSDEYTETKGKTSHDIVLSSTTDSTCTIVGQKNYTCKNCTYTYSEEIAKKSHNYSEATCTAPKTCKICGETEGQELGHSDTLICTRCGETTFETVIYTGKGNQYYRNIAFPAGKYNVVLTLGDSSGYDSLSLWIHEGTSDHYIGGVGQNKTKFETYIVTTSFNSGYISVEAPSDATWTIEFIPVSN